MSRLLTLLVLLSLPVAVSAQSLGEVAAKEKEKREQEHKAKDKNAPPPKVYTEADLKKDGAKKKGGASPSPSAGATPAPSSDAEGARRAAEETQWRAQARQFRGAVATTQKRIDDLEQQTARLAGTVLQSTDTYQIIRLREDQQKLARSLDDAKQALAQQKKDLEAFEDRARRAGIPPAWIDPDR